MKKVTLPLFALGLLSVCLTCPAHSFDQALAKILQRSTSVAVQEVNLKAVRSANLPIRLFFVPSIHLEAKQEKSEAAGVGSNRKQLQAVARLNLFRFGADYAALSAANSEETRQEALLQAEVLKVEEEAVRTLAAVLSTGKQLEILKKIASIQEDTLKIANERYRLGLLPIQEVEKLSVDLENSQSRLIDAEIREYEAKANLLALLGDVNIAPEWPWKEHFRSHASHALLQTPLNLPERPDFRAAEARVEVENQQYRQKQRLIFPSLDASFAYGYSTGLSGWTGMLTLSVPLFDHLSNYSSARSQSFVRESAEFNLEQVQRTAKSEWESAKKSFESALRSAISREKTLEVSRKLYVDNLKRFQSGRINANEFTIDQNRLFDSELFLVQGWNTAHLAYAQFCHSLGRRISSCQR